MYQKRGWSQVEENAFTWLHVTVQSWSPLIKWLHHLIKFIWDLLSSRNYVSSLFKLLLEMPFTFFTFVKSNSCYLTGVQGCNLHIRSLCTECAVHTLISKVKAPYLSDRAFWCCLFGMTLSMNQLEELILILLMTTPRPTESVSYRLATLLYIQTTQECENPSCVSTVKMDASMDGLPRPVHLFAYMEKHWRQMQAVCFSSHS